ncbi:MAG: hypothetical protein M3Q03_19810 [Chloroflexota bacterium]|nr:hypothetical protein [Chloroflexota bacterium]
MGEEIRLAMHTAVARPRPLMAYASAASDISPNTTATLTPPSTIEDDIRQAHQRLVSLGELEANWDSYGAVPPARRSLLAASRLIDWVATVAGPWYGAHALPQEIVPFPDGGVELEWSRPGKLVAVEIGQSGKMNYMVKTGQGRGAKYQEKANASWPGVLMAIVEVLAT